MNDILITPPTKKELPEMKSILADGFTKNVPIVVSQRIEFDEFCTMVDRLLNQTTDNGLTFVAKKRNGQVIGASVSYSLKEANKISSSYYGLSPKFLPNFELAKSIIDKYFASYKTTKRVTYWHMVAIDECYRRMDIAAELERRTEKMAKSLGFELIIACASHPNMAKLFEKLNYQCVGKQSYCDFETVGGVKPFRHLPAMISNRFSNTVEHEAVNNFLLYEKCF